MIFIKRGQQLFIAKAMPVDSTIQTDEAVKGVYYKDKDLTHVSIQGAKLK